MRRINLLTSPENVKKLYSSLLVFLLCTRTLKKADIFIIFVIRNFANVVDKNKLTKIKIIENVFIYFSVDYNTNKALN